MRFPRDLMHDQQEARFRNTSLPLIILTLIAGIALGWLLRDMLRQPAETTPTLPSASAVAVVPTAMLSGPAPPPPTAPPPTAAQPTPAAAAPTALPTQV